MSFPALPASLWLRVRVSLRLFPQLLNLAPLAPLWTRVGCYAVQFPQCWNLGLLAHPLLHGLQSPQPLPRFLQSLNLGQPERLLPHVWQCALRFQLPKHFARLKHPSPHG